MRATKTAIAEALRTDAAVSELVPATSVYATERATLPTLPAIEVIAVSTERVEDGPMVRHELSIEVTVSHATEDGPMRRWTTSCGPSGSDSMLLSASFQRLRWRAVRAVWWCWRGHAGPSRRRLRRASYGARRSPSLP